MLRDRLVIGVQDSHIQRRLLAEKALSFDKAFELAQSLEQASESAIVIQNGRGATAQDEVVHKIKGTQVAARRPSYKPESRDPVPPCYRCGKSNHTPGMCKFRTATCHGCGKIGHIKLACLNKSRQQQPKTAGNVRHVREETQEEDYASQEEDYASQEEAFALFHTPATGKSKPYFITMEVESRSLIMEIDTCASLSIISEQTKEKLWPSKRLVPTTAKLRTYSGEELPVKGTMKVKV